jgi:acetylornithine deacetylase/succinyl-diaminopimelate desuccinylase-like protein
MALPESTLKQRQFIRSLLDTRAGTEVAEKNREMLNNSLKIRGYIPKLMASQAIDALTSIRPNVVVRIPPCEYDMVDEYDIVIDQDRTAAVTYRPDPEVDPDEAEAEAQYNYAQIARDANERFALEAAQEFWAQWVNDVTGFQVEIILELARDRGIVK